MISVPPEIGAILAKLRAAGYEAQPVGGCVRDSLLGLTPGDWDICTSALPEEIVAVFGEANTIPTGLKHGTVTVRSGEKLSEVTTYRTDGAYTDHRHPDSVSFVTDLTEDLARRDFTVNAMACHPSRGLQDPFGGRQDLANRVIRCVGDPAQRFEEDALRILRALRFAAVYAFSLDPATAAAVHALAPTLSRVAPERLRVELLKLLCGPAAGAMLRAFPDVMAILIPELDPMPGYDQRNHHHHFDLWEHTVQTIENVPPEEDLRLTMLLHDTGKPLTQTIDEKGEAHYRGHPKFSAEIAERVCAALRCDRAQQDRVVRLVLYHDIPIRTADGAPNTDRRFLLRMLNRFGERDTRALFRIHRADRIATGITSHAREDARMKIRMDALDDLLASQPCFTLKDLALNGRDLLARGLRGPAVGEALQKLLDAVMDGAVPNEREDLLAYLDTFVTKI